MFKFAFILGRTVTTVMEEKRYNPRLNKSRQEFIQLMKTQNFAHATENQMGNISKYLFSAVLRIIYN